MTRSTMRCFPWPLGLRSGSVLFLGWTSVQVVCQWHCSFAGCCSQFGLCGHLSVQDIEEEDEEASDDGLDMGDGEDEADDWGDDDVSRELEDDPDSLEHLEGEVRDLFSFFFFFSFFCALLKTPAGLFSQSY